MKRIIFVLFIITVAMVNLYGQETAKANIQKNGYIKPTFSIGYSSFDIRGQKNKFFATGIDVDFVCDFGLTFGIKSIISWNSEGNLTVIPIGIGYTLDDKFNYENYLGRSASIGFKLVVMPYTNKPAIGFDINAVLWLTENTGLCPIFDIYFMKGTDYAALSFRLGYTMIL
jgi:hypothetical protein